jgi:hypothetical protein
MSLFLHRYILAVPEGRRYDAEALAPNLGNPGGVNIGAGWARYPQNILDPAEYWIGSFQATENMDDVPYSQPSKEALEGALGSGNPALSAILWWRMDNPYLPGNSPILRAHHAACTGCVIGEPWSEEQAIASLGYGGV